MNRVQSSHRLEKEAGRNIELMWLTGRLAPDFKTIADFRRDNGKAIQKACREFVLLCRKRRKLATPLRSETPIWHCDRVRKSRRRALKLPGKSPSCLYERLR
jgi:hypothetical protein